MPESFNNFETDKSARVLPDIVSTIIKTLPKGKTGGEDQITYEHLIYTNEVISSVLANIFTYMLRHAYIPDFTKVSRNVRTIPIITGR